MRGLEVIDLRDDPAQPRIQVVDADGNALVAFLCPAELEPPPVELPEPPVSALPVAEPAPDEPLAVPILGPAPSVESPPLAEAAGIITARLAEQGYDDPTTLAAVVAAVDGLVNSPTVGQPMTTEAAAI